MKKSTITILICILFSIGLKAQLSADSHLSNINFMSGTNVHGYGFGGSYLKAFTGKFLIGFTANIYLGGKQVTSDTAFANGGWPTADPILVDVTRKVISYTGDLDLRYSRLYFHMTYALMQNYNLTGINYANATSFEPTTGFINPTFSKIGWRFGLDKHLGFKNSNFSGTVGFEYAVLPFMKATNPSGVIETSPREYFSIHFGIGFGGKPLSN